MYDLIRRRPDPAVVEQTVADLANDNLADKRHKLGSAMLKFLITCAIIINCGICESIAGKRQNATEIVHLSIPGTTFEIVIDPAEIHRETIAPTPALINAITTWLADEFELPQISEPPSIKFISPTSMSALLYRDVPADQREQYEVVAFYDNEKRTIYLPHGWSGHSAAELSIVVHEMVHHIQNLAGLKQDCRESREKLAFAAQERWLNLFGRDLATEFGIDSFTLLVRTNCFY
jgi:hypothetical protein